MGASGNVFVKSAVILILLGTLTVNGFENDDLVFDQDGRNSAIEVSLAERQKEQSFLERVRRGVWDWFAPVSTTSTPITDGTELENQTTEPSYDQTLATAFDTFTNESKDRKARESGEENTVDQTSPKNENIDIGDTAAGHHPLPIYPSTDDEDLGGSGDVEGSAVDGDGFWDHTGTEVPIRPDGQPRHYRMMLTVMEPYKREYSDRTSDKYQELSGNLTEAIEELYRRMIPNFEHSAKVVKISPLPDPFSTQATVDLSSMFSDEFEIHNILQQQLQLHSLGSMQVRPDGFTFRNFQDGGEQECDENSELRCRDGTCIPLSLRCDGISQCLDNSDELDCPSETTTEQLGSQSTTKEDEDDDESTPSLGFIEPTLAQPRKYDSSNDTTTTVLDADKVLACRGDDYPVVCNDGRQRICSVRKCDGVPDCNDGSDEEGCSSLVCEDGEFACDITRCILDSKRCDYKEDCEDGSDEHNCSYRDCAPTEFQCRNSQCIAGNLRCNGISDCRDESDEVNCPCKVDQFECTPLYCISLDRRCNGIYDCSNGHDEEDCASYSRCRQDEFECHDGSCVSLRARCDGRSDCSDRSDERNCTVITCSSDQFPCQDGTCLDIGRRCNGYRDCRNGEDEVQCGCGPSEFSCNDGQCVSYRLQCNGVNDCRDGSDERDCVKDKAERRDMHNGRQRHHQVGPITTWQSKKLSRKRPIQGRSGRLTRKQEKKIKLENSTMRALTSSLLEIPSAGRIGDPRIAAFPELKAVIEKIVPKNDTSEEESPNKDWEYANLGAVNDRDKSVKTKALLRHGNHDDLDRAFVETRKVTDLLPDVVYSENELDTEDSDKDFNADDYEDSNENIYTDYATETLEVPAPTRNGHSHEKRTQRNTIKPLGDWNETPAPTTRGYNNAKWNPRYIIRPSNHSKKLDKLRKANAVNKYLDKWNVTSKAPQTAVTGVSPIVNSKNYSNRFNKKTEAARKLDRYDTEVQKSVTLDIAIPLLNRLKSKTNSRVTKNYSTPSRNKDINADDYKHSNENIYTDYVTKTLETPTPTRNGYSYENWNQRNTMKPLSDWNETPAPTTRGYHNVKWNPRYTIRPSNRSKKLDKVKKENAFNKYLDKWNVTNQAPQTAVTGVSPKVHSKKYSNKVKKITDATRKLERYGTEVRESVTVDIVNQLLNRMPKTTTPVIPKSKTKNNSAKFMTSETTMISVIANSVTSENTQGTKAVILIDNSSKEFDDLGTFSESQKIDDGVDPTYPELSTNTENYYDGWYDDKSDESEDEDEDEDEDENKDYDENYTSNQTLSMDTTETNMIATSKPKKESLYKKYKKMWNPTKKIPEAATTASPPLMYDPKKDVVIISNTTIFSTDPKSKGKLYRYTKDLKVVDSSDVVNKILKSMHSSALPTATSPPTAIKKVNTHGNYMNKHTSTVSSNVETNLPTTSSNFVTKGQAEITKDSTKISVKTKDSVMKKNKGIDKKTNKRNKGRRVGSIDWRNYKKTTTKPDLHANLKVESGLYKTKKVKLDRRLEFDDILKETTERTMINATVVQKFDHDHDELEKCNTTCVSNWKKKFVESIKDTNLKYNHTKEIPYWKKKFVESINDTNPKSNQTKEISFGNKVQQNIYSDLIELLKNCTVSGESIDFTYDGSGKVECKEISTATTKGHDQRNATSTTKILESTTQTKEHEDVGIITTDKPKRKSNNKKKNHKNNKKKKNNKRNKNKKRKNNKNGGNKNGSKRKTTTHGISVTTKAVDETIATNKADKTEGLNQSTEARFYGKENFTKIIYGWTKLPEIQETAVVNYTTAITSESDSLASTKALTTDNSCSGFDCRYHGFSEEKKYAVTNTTEEPKTSAPGSSTGPKNTESTSQTSYPSSSENFIGISRRPDVAIISTGAARNNDSKSMESSGSRGKKSRISKSSEVVFDSKEEDTMIWETTTLAYTHLLDGDMKIDMETNISDEILHINKNPNMSKKNHTKVKLKDTEKTTRSSTIRHKFQEDDLKEVESSEVIVKETSTKQYVLTSVTPRPFKLTTSKSIANRCKPYQYSCDDYRCIDIRNVCDKVPHCYDGSDETNCPWRFYRIKESFDTYRCRIDQFPCDNTKCLEMENVCDGIRHCADRTDENSCDYYYGLKNEIYNEYVMNYHGRLASTTTKRSITTRYTRPPRRRPNPCHPELEFKCNDGRCIPDFRQCDGIADCNDAEDEDSYTCLGFAPCPSMDFTCEDGSCIPKTSVCDGIDDCPGAGDELHCDRECTPTQFKCVSEGKCIDGIYRCDGHPDCPDRSDEDRCTGSSNENVTHTVIHTNTPSSRPWITERPGSNKECDPRTEMRCDDGQCILLRRKCDNVFDCLDNSDERDCGGCKIDEWKCASGECVTENARCDGEVQCPDGSDEIECAECPAGTFRCNDGLCLDSKRYCDGHPNCRDGSDEINCQTPYCPEGQLPCGDGSCIFEKLFCNNEIDCRDASDERNCPDTKPQPPGCRSDQYTCRDGSCIPQQAYCDGRADCPDDDDERNCRRGIEASDKTSSRRHPENVQLFTDSTVALGAPYGVTGTETGPWSNQTAPRICTEGDFICADGTCIPAAHRCDNFYDCRDFTDEQYCFGCSRDQFQCRNGDCINNVQKCDKLIDCDDSSDEEGCEPETPSSSRYCSSDQFTCVYDRTCVHHSSRCNGIPDCRDNSDEDGCDSDQREGLNLKTYPSEQIIKENPAKQGREVVFQCRDEGSLRAKVRWIRGNGLPLPPGARDINGRLEIPNIKLEHSGTYICEAIGYPRSTPGQQVSVHLEVEKLEIPVTRPPQVCKYEEATCSNGDCIPKSLVCNGKYDCTDGSDEMRCSPHGCEPNQFRCENKECVSKIWRCDGDKDCRDGTDEENCEAPPPGSPCRYDEYQCAKYDQCIPKSYHCDMERDCQDGSDEFGCSPVYITNPPPGMMTLHIGEAMILTCTAIGIPIPEINWRLNWGHVPSKCFSTSQNGTGTLTCPDIQVSDQGAYSCEALNVGGFVFAVPDTILVVEESPTVCPEGTFNDEARTPEECISCFCFGVSNRCKSANLFIYQLRPPFDRFRVVSVKTSPTLSIQNEISSQVAEVRPRGSNGADITAPNITEFTSYNVPYFAIPNTYYESSSLKSYGGYLKYTVFYSGDGVPNNAPDVVISGNRFVLLHRGNAVHPDIKNDRQVRFFYGDWYKKNDRGQDILATREEIMMVLAKVDHILIKAKYENSPELQVSITDIVMDTADATNTGLGAASYVEKCSCPTGYYGDSCESCAPGFQRRTSGPWLGECYIPNPGPVSCKAGYYGDPLRNIPCERCPCPLTNPSNQFARTCRLGADHNPVCDCLPEYSGLRCEKCADGYHGNPMIPGDMCVPNVSCDPRGSLTLNADADGKCRCKQYATGLLCDQCKANTFNLASKNQFGCISCFCMGITDRCNPSHWFRNEIRVSFTNSIRDFTLVESNTPNAQPISEGIRLDTISREIVYSAFPNRGNTDVYYWQLPSIFLGNQITSYGGNLRYTVRYVPSPGGQSSRNNAADVELISANDINLLYYSRETPESNTPQSFSVPLLEQYWQRSDGTQADREHLLMALADVQAIRIKATYTTHTNEAALSLVSLDTAEKYNTGRERAIEVEECSCPVGYRGLSCEDCTVGYTRAIEGLYLGICTPCNCNGHSSQCDPETGICENCGNHTTGENCEFCEPGYKGDATRGSCVSIDDGRPKFCDCNPAGSESIRCVDGRCYCKPNVEGLKCNRCRPSTFGLSADNIDGCNECYCSGVTNQCHESSLYIQQLPMWVYDSHHGFTLTDASRLDVIDDGFDINVALNEIGYRYSNNRNRRLFWSLPATFTGNKVKSYGGKLTLTQHITAHPNSKIVKDQDVMLIGNGITLFWTNPQEILPGIPLTYAVPLRESEWRRLSNAGPRPASRTELMTVLSNLDAILVRASHSEGMIATYISDISLDIAVETRGSRRATQIEACTCPRGYSGTSCETCAHGYYRDFTNRSVSILGSCNACPCNDHEESCEIGQSGQVKCNCRSGYSGQYCQDIVELKVGLMPINAQAPRYSIVNFTCSYYHGDTLYIYFKLTQYYGLPLTAWAMVPGPIVTTDNGAFRVWSVHVGNNPCKVECLIVDRQGKQLAMITTRISPVDYPLPPPTLPPPKIPHPKIAVSIQEKKFQIVQTGSTVRLHCSGRSVDNTPLRIQWEKEGTPMPDRSSDDHTGLLIIRDIRVSDSGIYVCRVTDGISVALENVSIAVGRANPEAPRVSIHPSDLEVKEGEPVEFRCEATGNPEPEIEWVRVQGTMNPEARLYKGVWSIPAAMRSDAAEYKCIAKNDIGIDAQTTVLYVLDGSPTNGYPNIPPTISPSQWTGSAGDTVRLICARSNYHASVFWIRSGNQALPMSSSQRDGVLTIGNPIPTDSGVYICTASSIQGTETSTSANVTIFPKRTQPSVRVEPERQTVSQGTEAEVRCIVDRESGLQIKWVKHGEPSIGPNARQVGDTLKIISPQVSDRGIYICRASNAAGSYEASAVIEVEPRETPVLELYPKNSQTVNLGSSADIQCRVMAGFPMPEVRWTREDGRPFTLNIQQLPGGVLRLTNVTEYDAGAYRCSASNSVGSTSAIARIEVQSLPIITVTPAGGLIYAKLGDRVTLTCSAQGLPQPNVVWMKSRPGVSIHNFFGGPNASRLTAVHEITSMSVDDEGSYTCQAINAAGVTEERVQIRIEDDNSVGEDDDDRGPGERGYNGGVRILNDNLSIPIGGTVMIRCQVYGPSDSRIDIDWRRSDRRPLPKGSSVHNRALTIPDVTREAAGEYICLGLDPSGSEVFRAKAHLDVISPPRIALNPNRQTVSPGESPTIECTATGDQPLTIEWDAIGRRLPYSVSKDRGLLKFNRITYTDAGKYVCKASNGAGTAEAVAEVLVSENTIDKPFIHAVDKDITTYAGSTVTLRCNVQPLMTIHWSKDGQPLSRNARVGEDYIELTHVQSEDGGTYICQVSNSHGESSDLINLRVKEAENSAVTIKPSQDVVNIGDMIDLSCTYTGAHSPRYRWSRPNHASLPQNALEHGNILRISNIELSESGVYRCHADTQEGSYDGDYNLIVQGGTNDAPAIETKYVPYGKGLEMSCRVNLEQPVSFEWSKLGGLLPHDTETYDNKLKLSKVKAEDAGTYICTATNGVKSAEIPTVLVVTGVVPNFHQAPQSWISLPPLPDSYLRFNIEVSFKPENYDGVILYNDETTDGTGDYIMLSLIGGYPEFNFDLGSGAVIIKADKPVTLGEWHTIKLLRNRKDGTMLVDGEGPYKAENSGKKQGLDLKEPLYIGGVPDYNAINSQAGAKAGFVGCISRLVLGNKSVDLIGEQTDSVGVTTCETCAENPCNNAGVCQEASTNNGYRCLCRAGYSGKHCDSIGQSCYPGACGDGNCVDKENGFECYCPHGKSGTHCELFTPNLNELAFRNARAYVAYPTPTSSRRLKLSMNFKPSDNGDGILMYCSQSDEGLGDFVALVIKDRYVEFRFDVGSGMAVVRSNHVVQPGAWIHVTLSRELRDGKISINGEEIFEGRSPGSARTMTLNTPLYIGGIDRRRITINRKTDVQRNFYGCINELEVSLKNFHFLKSIMDSANVEDCSSFPVWNDTRLDLTTQQPTRPPTTVYDPCERKPCVHGVCQIVGNFDYSCTCDYGYVGRDCEKILKQCELLRPCQNDGSCMDLHGSYKCDCRLGFNGKDCEKRVEIVYDVAFRGDGWLELERSVMTHEEEFEVLCFEISTNKSNGLIMWHGQTPNDLSPDDYIALAVVDGYVEFQYNLGSGPAVMRVTAHGVDDGERHRIILKRQRSEGNIELDGEHMESGVSDGLQQLLNVRGSVYLGGVPDWAMTYGRYQDGFSGCIYAMEVQDSASIDIGAKAIRGKNVAPCTRVRWIPSSLIFTDVNSDGFDDFVPPPPVNIIHPKPTVNLATTNIKSIYLLIAVQNGINFSTNVKTHSILRTMLCIALVTLAKSYFD